jgi:uncharacterized protein YndB with AHSA1/START domain
MAPDYSTRVTIARPPADVFAAILDTKDWWNSTITGSTHNEGDEWGFTVEGLHRTRMRVSEVTPNQRVEWTVLENEFGFTKDQTEWVGDRLLFSLEPIAEGTLLTFTQHGLVPDLECYDVCSNAWTFFIGESLRQFAETGVGKPESQGEAPPADRARAAVDQLQKQ